MFKHSLSTTHNFRMKSHCQMYITFCSESRYLNNIMKLAKYTPEKISEMLIFAIYKKFINKYEMPSHL